MFYVILLAILFAVIGFIVENLKVIIWVVGSIVCLVTLIIVINLMYKKRMRKTIAIYRGNGKLYGDYCSDNLEENNKEVSFFVLANGEGMSFERISCLSDKDYGKYGLLKYTDSKYSFRVFKNQEEGRLLFEEAERKKVAKTEKADKLFELFCKLGWYIYDLILALALFSGVSSTVQGIIIVVHGIMSAIRIFAWVSDEDIEFKWYTLWLLGDIAVGTIAYFRVHRIIGLAIVFFTGVAWVITSIVSFVRMLIKKIDEFRWR